MRSSIKSLVVLVLFILTLPLFQSYTQEMEFVCKIDFQDKTFEENLDKVSLNLYFKNKKLFKSVVGFEFNQIIKIKYCDLSNEKIENFIFVAYSKDGSSQKFFYSDISPNISKIPVFIAFREKVSIKDTTRIENVNKSLTSKDIEKLDNLTTYLKLYKIYLQFNKISPEDEKRIFTNYFLIFPQDQTVKRWIGNLDYLEIYKLKKI